MQPVITTSRNKARGTASHKKSASNVSLSSENERERGAKPDPGPRSRSAVPTTSITRAPRPLVLNEAPRASAADSPPMFADSDISQSSSEKIVRGPKKAEPVKPLITLVPEGQGGTFYCGTGAVQKAIANTKAFSEGLLRDGTNKSKLVQEQGDSSDYFLLTEFIGTEWLISCAGLFFSIGKDCLFFAHIFVGWKGGMPRSGLMPEDCVAVSKAILKRLEYLSKEQAWTPKDVAVETLIIANGQGADLAYPVRDAVARFIGLKDPAALKDNMKSFGGFAVHRNGDFLRSYDTDQHIDDYSVSGHSRGLRPNLWRYIIGQGWAARLAASEGAE